MLVTDYEHLWNPFYPALILVNGAQVRGTPIAASNFKGNSQGRLQRDRLKAEFQSH